MLAFKYLRMSAESQSFYYESYYVVEWDEDQLDNLRCDFPYLNSSTYN